MFNIIRILSPRARLSCDFRAMSESIVRMNTYPTGIFRYMFGSAGLALAATVATSDQPSQALMIPTRLARDAIAVARIVSGQDK